MSINKAPSTEFRAFSRGMMHYVPAKFPLILASMGLVMLFSFFGVSAVAVGRGGVMHPALVGFIEACAGQPQPCWNGIVPGVTSGAEAAERMAFAGDSRVAFNELTEAYAVYYRPPASAGFCFVAMDVADRTVQYMQLQPCKDTEMKLGDFAALFGVQEQSITLLDVTFGGVRVKTRWWSEPQAGISHVSLVAPARQDDPVYRWRGFVGLWRYCQFEPGYPLC